MSEMVERMAGAMREADMNYPNDAPTSEVYAFLARAALKAMREPTPEMLHEARYDIMAEDGAESWRIMIDTALNGPAESAS